MPYLPDFQTFARHAAGKKLVPVATQMALAEQALRANPAAANVLVAIDARMNEIYFAAYQRDSAEPTGWRVVIAPMLVKPHELPEIPKTSEGVLVKKQNNSNNKPFRG